MNDCEPCGWFKSSFSTYGNCVEVRFLPDGSVAVRDTNDRSRPALVFDSAEWAAFMAGVQAGEFDPR